MSNDSKGIMHFIGIAFTVVTTLVSIMTQCQPKEDKAAARNALLLQTPPKSPVIQPLYWAEMLDPDWHDSLPFDLPAVRAAGMRYITVEEYALNPGEDTMKQALEWGIERGERTRLTQYTLDMQRPVLKSLRVKEFRGTEVKPPKTVVWTGFYDYQYALGGEMTGVEIRESGDGEDLDESASWLNWSGNRRKLDFTQSKDWQWLRQEDTEVALVQQDGAWHLKCWDVDSVIRVERLKSKIDKMLKDLQDDGDGPVRAGTIEVVQGNRLRPRRKTELDSLWKPIRSHQCSYDKEGRPESTLINQPGGNLVVIMESKEYGPFGLMAVKSEFEGIVHRMKVSYENGWPKRLVLWSETLDGRIKVLSRIFIRFQSN
ncbi:MAG: hypothetical protein U0176_25270 [Bacteroidia bacterium]